MTIEGFNKTGFPSCLWEFVEPFAQINHASGIAVLAVLIVILSNVVSNVPTGIVRTSFSPSPSYPLNEIGMHAWTQIILINATSCIYNARHPFMGH